MASPSWTPPQGRLSFASRKKKKVASLFSDFKPASSPQNCGAGGGLLWWCVSFMSLGWVSLVFRHLPPAFALLYSHILQPAAVNQQLKPSPFLAGSVSPLSSSSLLWGSALPHCFWEWAYRGASTTAAGVARGGSLLGAMPGALPHAASLPQGAADTMG